MICIDLPALACTKVGFYMQFIYPGNMKHMLTSIFEYLMQF